MREHSSMAMGLRSFRAESSWPKKDGGEDKGGEEGGGDIERGKPEG